MPWVGLTAALGVVMAIPMKRNMINRERLKFPTGTAAAVTLQSLYGNGREAIVKARALLAAVPGVRLRLDANGGLDLAAARAWTELARAEPRPRSSSAARTSASVFRQLRPSRSRIHALSRRRARLRSKRCVHHGSQSLRMTLASCVQCSNSVRDFSV